MSKIDKTTSRNCTACSFLKHGVKTRKSIPHTCGKTLEQIRNFIKKSLHEKKEESN